MPQKLRSSRQDWVKTTVNLPPDLHEQIKDKAEREERSMEAWMRYAFRKALAEIPS